MIDNDLLKILEEAREIKKTYFNDYIFVWDDSFIFDIVDCPKRTDGNRPNHLHKIIYTKSVAWAVVYLSYSKFCTNCLKNGILI